MGRRGFKIRKDKPEIVKRHGLYKKDLERFAETIVKRQAQPLFAEQPGNSSPALQ